jgi:prepilin-type N-terminal cleavage/methylation domain-containing protein
MKHSSSAVFDSRKIRNPQSAIRNCPAFTLLELLVVITILGILAALSVPALKNLGKSNVQVSASRQMLDDIGRARQLAISQHTTVYMVFVPPNFWLPGGSLTWWNNLTPAQKAAGTNLLDKQGTGYNFISLRSVGDQPGQGRSRYISEWKSLPDGTFIATNKFNASAYYPNNPNNYYPIVDYSFATPVSYPIFSFNTNNSLPFPVETNFNANVFLPFIAFNYLGQLTVDGTSLALRDEFIPLAQGGVLYAMDVNKALVLGPADFTENPPGNSTNSMFNVIRIDRLTGRATSLQQKVAP